MHRSFAINSRQMEICRLPRVELRRSLRCIVKTVSADEQNDLFRIQYIPSQKN
jgi:hypothetical protein